ncbi:MAG: MFS transporter [Pseudomonadota bacterium]
MTQFKLLGHRRFGPYFAVQALGAFNDNIFRNALSALIVYGIAVQAEMDINGLVNLAVLLFILPFFLFSAVFGQLADRYEKSRMIRLVKLFEVMICLFAGFGLYTGNLWLLLGVVFLLGFQSTLFGPIKYSILPQLLDREELTGGNALVAAGTYIAILAGTILGPIVAGLDLAWPWMVLVATLATALLGWWAAYRVPAVPIGDQQLSINFNPVTASWANLRILGQNRTLLNGVLGIAWFWFYGTIVLAQIPAFTQGVMGANETVLAGFLGLFIIGISTGALLCEKLSNGGIEIGLVPIGAAGLTVFGLDLMWASPNVALVDAGYAEVLAMPGIGRVVFDLLMIGISGGLFIVPLYALIQAQSRDDQRAQVIAGMNILNALFMVLASVLAIVLLTVVELSIPTLFGVVAVLNLLVAIYIFTLVPQFVLRFLMWILSRLIYRVDARGSGLKQIPETGPALVVCNHLSYMDPLIVGGTIHRPIRFVMTHKIYQLRGLTWLFKLAGAIPVAPAKVDPDLLKRAFEAVDDALANGELVGIFPEGGLSPDGEVQPFKSGVSDMLSKRPVPVIPMVLEGLWGSAFSRKPGRWRSRDRGFFSRVRLQILDPIPAKQADREPMQQLIIDHYDRLRHLKK